METSDGWTGSRWWVWSSWDSSHEDGAAKHNDSWNAKSSWETHNKSGVSEHDGSHSEWMSWDSGRQSGVAQHDDWWNAKSSWETRRQSGASEHDDAGGQVEVIGQRLQKRLGRTRPSETGRRL